MYAKITNGVVSQYPYTIGQFRRDNPNTSFPKDVPIETLNAFGVVEVTATPKPAIDNKTHTQTRSVDLVNGSWVETWASQQRPEEDAGKNVRGERNRLLAQSDWTQGKDIPEATSTAWATYRQALRDIPTQAGFPYNVTWPQEP